MDDHLVNAGDGTAGLSLPRHAISLLVHEQLPVIVDQCRNFATFAPDSLIMLHVSATGSVGKDEVRAALAQAGLGRCIVNDVSHASSWGSIINGHFANVRALAGLMDPAGSVSLHSSNDMLLRPLPDPPALGARYETRKVTRDSLWYTGRMLAQAPALAPLLDALNCPEAVGGQVEGSVYPLTMLTALADAVEPHGALIDALPVAEEVLFPTWAHDRRLPPTAAPYVLCRPSLLPVYALALLPGAMRSTRFGSLIDRGLNRLEARMVGLHARMADVEAVIAGAALDDAAWADSAPPRLAMVFHGIKRVARRMDDPVRQRIARHTARQIGRQTAGVTA